MGAASSCETVLLEVRHRHQTDGGALRPHRRKEGLDLAGKLRVVKRVEVHRAVCRGARTQLDHELELRVASERPAAPLSRGERTERQFLIDRLHATKRLVHLAEDRLLGVLFAGVPKRNGVDGDDGVEPAGEVRWSDSVCSKASS